MAIGNIVQSNKEANFSDTSVKSRFKVTIKQASNHRAGNPAEAKSKDKFHKASRDYSRWKLYPGTLRHRGKKETSGN